MSVYICYQLRVVQGDELATARRAFEDAGLTGHHLHPLSHGGPAIPGPGGLVHTGESRILASQLEGLDLSFYSQYGKANSKRLAIHQPTPGGPLIFGNNPRHTAATNFFNKVARWQREAGLRQ